MLQHTRPESEALIYGNLPNNTSGYIDPEKLREVLLVLVASFLNLLDDGKPGAGGGAATPQPAQATFGNLGGQAADNVSLVSYVAALGHTLSEYLPPMATQQGRWYLAGTGIWEAKSNFNAAAPPAAGAYWRLVVDFGDALTATAAGKALLAAPTATAQRQLLDIFITTASQYGAGQPAFTNAYQPDGALVYLLKQVAYLGTQLQTAASPAKPAAPTAGQVDDTADTFSFLPNPAYPSFAQYKVSGLPGITGAVVLDGQNSYVSGSRVYIKVVGAVAKGGLAVYVAGSGAVPDGAVLTNADAFTGAIVVAPPASAALTAALAISVASIVAGSPLTFTVTAGGGTSPYSYAVVATNNATGVTTVLGSSATGSFTPQTPNTSYNIDATVTDAAGKVAQAITRTVQVTAAQTVNQLPVADAGQDLTITLPTSSVALLGTASDPDTGDTLTYLWRQITGPNGATGLPATSLNVVASNLVAGTYQFGFQATDQKGGKSPEDFVVVTVNAAVQAPMDAYVLLGDGQSNLPGLAPISALYTAQFAAVTNPALTQLFPNFLMWNVASQEFQPLQVGVNEYGLDGATLAALGATGYEDGFGWEVGLARRLAITQPSKKVYYIKYGGIPINSSEGLTLVKVMGQHHTLYKEQVQNAKAWLVAQGLTPRVKGFLFDQFESDTGNANYANELAAAFAQFLSEGLTEPDTRIVVVAADSPAGTPALVQAQTTVVNQDPTNRRLLAMAPDGTYLAQDNTHIDAKSMVIGGHKKLYNLLFDVSGGDLTISAATTTGGGNAAFDTGTLQDIANPANSQFLNLRWDAGTSPDASTWQSKAPQTRQVRQPLAAKRSRFVPAGLQITAGNQFMYTERFNVGVLDSMTYVFVVAGMQKRTNNPLAQSFLYNGDEDQQGAFSIYWDEVKGLIYARVKSLQSPVGDRSTSYYYFKSIPFNGGDCVVSVRYNRTRAGNCVRLIVNGVEAGPFTEFTGANKQPQFFLDGVLALFGQNQIGNYSLTGTVQAVAAWNYELTDAMLGDYYTDVLGSAPPTAPVSAWQAFAVQQQVAELALDTNGAYVVTGGAPNSWGHPAIAVGELAANAVGGIRTTYNPAYGLGAIMLNTGTALVGIFGGDCGGYFGVPETDQRIKATWYSGAASLGAELADLISPGGYMRVWRYANMNILLEYTNDGGATWEILHDYGTYAGALTACIDANYGAGRGCYKPETYNIG
jgi:hypothetical protein